MEEMNNCRICNADSNNIVKYLDGKDRWYEVEEGAFELHKCKVCETIFLFPQLSFNDLKKYYPDFYYSYHTEPVHSVFDNGLNKIKSFFYNSPFKVKKGTRILDIGCGNGANVAEYLKFGAECYGIDINYQAVEAANKKGVKAYYGDLFDQKFENNYFDVIILDNVFEHLQEPKKTISKIYQLLKTGGKIIITVPNYNSLSRIIFNRFWMGYEIPRHMFIYSPYSFKKLLENTALEIEKIRYCQNGYQIGASLRFLLRSISQIFILPSKPSWLFDSRVVKLLLLIISMPINMLHLGDTIKIIIVKK